MQAPVTLDRDALADAAAIEGAANANAARAVAGAKTPPVKRTLPRRVERGDHGAERDPLARLAVIGQ